MIQRHHDLGAQCGLDIDRALWRQHMERAVDVGAKTDAFFRDLCLLR